MSTMAWIAIAAIIVASINSWLQFWLKERSDKNKALANARPATNQPKADSQDADTKLDDSLRRLRLTVLVFGSLGVLSGVWGIVYLMISPASNPRLGTLYAMVDSETRLSGITRINLVLAAES